MKRQHVLCLEIFDLGIAVCLPFIATTDPFGQKEKKSIKIPSSIQI